EAVGKSTAAVNQPVQVWRLDFWIAERMNAAVRQIIGDQEEKIWRFSGAAARGTRDSGGCGGAADFEKFASCHDVSPDANPLYSTRKGLAFRTALGYIRRGGWFGNAIPAILHRCRGCFGSSHIERSREQPPKYPVLFSRS